MNGNLQVTDFKNIITSINKFFRGNQEFIKRLSANKRYFEGLNRILSKQIFHFILDGKLSKYSSEEISVSQKILILDSFNIINEECINCGLTYSQPIAGDQMKSLCSFCILVENYYFNDDFTIVIDYDVSEYEKRDTNVYVYWANKHSEYNNDSVSGYIYNLSNVLKIKRDTDLLESIRLVHEDYTNSELMTLSDLELRSIIYHHRSSEIKIKVIENIKSKDILYYIYHSGIDFKQEIEKRYYEIGGHLFDFWLFIQPPFLNTGIPQLDKSYNRNLVQLEHNLHEYEAKYSYYVETSKQLGKLMFDREKMHDIMNDDEIPTTSDIEYLTEEAMLGNVFSFQELWKYKKYDIIRELIMDSSTMIPFDNRLSTLLAIIKSNDFQSTLNKILDIHSDLVSPLIITLGDGLIKKIIDPKLKTKLLNHPFFDNYKLFKENNEKYQKYFYDRGFA